jgi:hypothetical protein
MAHMANLEKELFKDQLSRMKFRAAIFMTHKNYKKTKIAPVYILYHRNKKDGISAYFE